MKDFIINSYLKWIKDNTIFKSIEGDNVISVSTPYIDRNNDCIDIYIVKGENNYKLTDDGITMANLEMSGLSFNTEKREKVFESTLNGFGVQAGDNGELYIEADDTNLGEKKHSLIQCILSVDDLFVLAQENIKSFFKEDIELFFNSQNIIYSKNIKLAGKAGVNHNIDFVIPPIRGSKEKMIKAINNPSKSNIESTIFALSDISLLRKDTESYVIYNDYKDQKISPELTTALQKYGISTYGFSKKEDLKKELHTNIYV